ncbi:Uncharacterized protein TCM_010671 [Theobroma cacao]|uniref:Uncharacterized protein n=1 Tax=Theobroma cacao TaxID=3641 RepID=A0A061E803_THECC|nr:Uncharacterized protein TCM_010671 [Theobroma cacao]
MEDWYSRLHCHYFFLSFSLTSYAAHFPVSIRGQITEARLRDTRRDEDFNPEGQKRRSGV